MKAFVIIVLVLHCIWHLTLFGRASNDDSDIDIHVEYLFFALLEIAAIWAATELR